jgi:quinol monooxygenase YgiN
MITEYADFTIDPQKEPAFLEAVAKAAPIFRAAKGCQSMRLDRVIERSGVFRLIVTWATLADHTEGFRNSEGFAQWRALAGPFFVAPSVVEHTETAVMGFQKAG